MDNTHVIRFKLDAADVLSSLKQIGSQVNSLSKDALAKQIPDFRPPANVVAAGPGAIGSYAAQAQAVVARGIQSGVAGYKPGDAISPKVTSATAEAFRRSLEPLVAQMSRRDRALFEQGNSSVAKGVATRGARATIRSDDDFLREEQNRGRRKKRLLTEEERNDREQERAIRQQGALYSRKIAIQGRNVANTFGTTPAAQAFLNNVPGGNLVTNPTARQNLVQQLAGTKSALDDELQDQIVRAYQAQQAFARVRAINAGVPGSPTGPPGPAAIENAYNRGTAVTIAGESADLIRTNATLLNSIVEGRLAILKLTADEEGELLKRQLNDKALSAAEAERVVLEKRLNNEIQQRVIAASTAADRQASANNIIGQKIVDEDVRRRVLAGTTPADINNEARNNVDQAAQDVQRKLRESALTTDQQIKEEARLALATASLTARRQNAEAALYSTPAGKVQLANEGISAAGQARIKAEREAALLAATSDSDLRQRGLNAAARNRQNVQADLVTLGAQTPADTAALAQQAVTRQRLAREQELLVLQSTNVRDLAQQAQINNIRKRTTLELQASEFKELRGNKAFQEARALRVIEERKYIDEQRKTNRRVAAEQGYGGTSIFARALGRLGGAGGGIDGDSGGKYAGGIPPTLASFFGRGIGSVARYAIPSAIGYGAINGIGSTIKEAEELQRVFASVEAQFNAVFGVEESGPKFAAFRKNILDIASDTGTPAEEIANIGFQLQGAFGSKAGGQPGPKIDGLSGDRLVESQLRASAEIAKVTGLSATEITDSLTAISFGFDTTFRRVGDVTIGLQDRFGVLAKQIIPFLGDIAPVAKDAGFSLEEFATIAAATQQKSGRSGTALAEAYGRVIPAISQARSQLVALSTTNVVTPDFVKTVASGSIRDVFFAISKNFESLNEESKDFVINLLGGRREAAAILTAFNDSASLLSDIEKTKGTGNLLSERFEKISKTFTETMARLKEDFRQLGVAIYEGGLGDALTQFVSALGLVVNALDAVFGGFKAINDASDGWAGKIIGLTVAYLALSKALTAIAATQGATALLGLLGGKGIAGKAGAAAAGGAASNPAIAAYLGQGAAAAAPAAAAGRFAGLGAKIGIGATPFASGFAAANVIPVVAIAAAGAFIVKGMADGVAASIDKQKEKYALYTQEQLERAIRENGGGSDFRRGLAVIGGKKGRESDTRNLALDQYNRNAFFETGAIPLGNLDQGVTLPGFGVGEEDLKRAVQEATVIADVRKKITTQITSANLKRVTEIKKNIEDTQDILNDPGTQSGKGVAGSQYERNLERLGVLQAQLAKEGATGSAAETLVFLNNGDKDERKKLVEDLRSKDDATVTAALEEIIRQSETSTEFAVFLYSLLGRKNESFDAFLARLAKEKETAGIAVGVQASQVDLENLKASFDAGGTNYSDLLAAYDHQIAQQKGLLDSLGETTSQTYKDNKLIYDKLLQERNQFSSSKLAGLTDLRSEISQIGTGDTDASKLSEIEDLTKLLDDPNFLDADARIAAARKIVSLLQGLDEATVIPPQARQALAEAIYDPQDNPEWAAFLSAYKLAFGTLADSRLREIFIAASLGAGTLDEVRAELLKKRDELLTAAAVANAAGLDINSLGGNNNDAAARERALKFVEDQIAKLAVGKDKIPEKTSGKDPADAADKLREAKQDYLLSLIEGDPIKLAQLRVDQADEDLAAAKDEADTYKAMAAKVRAERGLASAKYDLDTAKGDLTSALAEYRGDSLKVAQLAVDQAIKDRDNANKLFETSGAGEAEAIKAEVALLGAKAKARDEQLNSQKDDYQFLYDMGQITKSQFIQYLKTLKQIPDLTTEQLRSLDREIKSLSQELQQDLQFNLPTSFKLPTLYEVRRIDQTGSSQAGYVDNRNVNIQINVNDGTTQQQMLQVLTDVMGNSPARVSTGQKRY